MQGEVEELRSLGFSASMYLVTLQKLLIACIDLEIHAQHLSPFLRVSLEFQQQLKVESKPIFLCINCLNKSRFGAVAFTFITSPDCCQCRKLNKDSLNDLFFSSIYHLHVYVHNNKFHL